MLALVKYGTGPRETELREVPVPEIGEDDLLIEVRAAGICGSDVGYDDGKHGNQLNCPVILGHEFSGIVAKTGKNVTEWKIGDRVVSDNTGYVCGKCDACTTGQYLMCPERLGLGYGMDGGFTDYVKIRGDLLARNPHTLFRIPENVSFEEAAILDPICNAYKAVVQESGILPGENIAVFGVGPIGLCVIQIAHVMGCGKIIALARPGNEKRFAIAREYGATHTVVMNGQDLDQELQSITGGSKVPVVIDAAGANQVLKEALSVVKKGGKIVKIGYDEQPYGYSLDCLPELGITIQGHFGYDYISWKNVLNLLEMGKLDLNGMISHYITLQDWSKGMDLMRKKEAVKVVITKDTSKLTPL